MKRRARRGVGQRERPGRRCPTSSSARRVRGKSRRSTPRGRRRRAARL
jgi:hypothetical protein